MSSITTAITSATTSSQDTVKHQNTSESRGLTSALSPTNDDCQHDDAQHFSPNRIATPTSQGYETSPLRTPSSTILSMEWAQLPKMPALPPRKDFEPIERFVTDSIQSRHVEVPESEKGKMRSPHKGLPTSAGYRSILDLMQKKEDLPMLKKVLLALRTQGIERMSSERTKHSRLIHFIFGLNPFDLKERGHNHHRLLAMNNNNITMNGQSSRSSAGTIEEVFTLAEVFLNLIVALTSANSVFLTPTLNALWRMIIQTDAVTPHDQQLYLTQLSLAQTEREKQLFIQRQLRINSLLHGTLRKVLQLIPKGNSEIFPVIASSFPFKLAPLPNQVNYMKQSLIVVRYVPSMQRQFLELCVDKCLEIDVEIQVADNGSVKIEEKKSVEDDDDNDISFLFHDAQTEQHEEKDSSDHLQNEKATFKDQSEEDKVDEMAEKLDTLMYLVFEHLHLVTSAKQMTPSSLFKMLLPSFESVILTTHRCKFIQFLIIFLCGLNADETEFQDSIMIEGMEGIHNHPANDRLEQPELFREFAAKLIDIVLDPYRATVTRQSAACYLASFVSRTACVNTETACESVSALLRFAEAYMDAYPTEASARNARRYLGADADGEQADRVSFHSLFYTISQASFYIMCFRGKECIEYYRSAVEYHQNLDNSLDSQEMEYGDPELIDISDERWNRVCSHHFNPLKFCLESVRGEFLLLADNFDLLDQDLLNKLIIEDRKMESSSRLSMSTIPSSLQSGVKRIRKKRRKVSSIQTAATLQKRRIAGGVGGLGKGSNPLDSFFPFDPYLLRRSYEFIDPYYRHWSADSCEVDSKDSDTNDLNKKLLVLEEEEKGMSVDNEEYDGASSGTDSEEDDDDDGDGDDDKDEVKDLAKEEDVEEKVDRKETAAMSLTSATMSMGGSEWTDELTDTEVNDSDSDSDSGLVMDTNPKKRQLPGRTSWVHELKRARTLSVGDDCW